MRDLGSRPQEGRAAPVFVPCSGAGFRPAAPRAMARPALRQQIPLLVQSRQVLTWRYSLHCEVPLEGVGQEMGRPDERQSDGRSRWEKPFLHGQGVSHVL